jgi:hypothetical protein
MPRYLDSYESPDGKRNNFSIRSVYCALWETRLKNPAMLTVGDTQFDWQALVSTLSSGNFCEAPLTRNPNRGDIGPN